MSGCEHLFCLLGVSTSGCPDTEPMGTSRPSLGGFQAGLLGKPCRSFRESHTLQKTTTNHFVLAEGRLPSLNSEIDVGVIT